MTDPRTAATTTEEPLAGPPADAGAVAGPPSDAGEGTALVETELLVEEISIDGMCGVY